MTNINKLLGCGIPEDLKQKIKAEFEGLQANNARLREASYYFARFACDEDMCDCYNCKLRNVLAETPAQSTNQIKADAVEENMPDKIEPKGSFNNSRYCLGWNDYNRELRTIIGELRNKEAPQQGE